MEGRGRRREVVSQEERWVSLFGLQVLETGMCKRKAPMKAPTASLKRVNQRTSWHKKDTKQGEQTGFITIYSYSNRPSPTRLQQELGPTRMILIS